MTTGTTHTPGPWRFWPQRRPQGEDTCTFRGPDGQEVLRAVTVTLTEADARLIAAAPELLEALHAAHAFITNGVALGFIRMPDADTPDPAHNTLPAIKAAIAKTKGAA